MEEDAVYALWFSLFAVATIVTGLRIGIRLRMGARKLFPEDILMIIAWFCYLALVVVLAVAAEYGLGHPTPADLTEEQQIGILKYFFYHGYELYLTLWFVKVSIIAFYARISWGTSYRSYRILAYITMVILFCSFVVIMFYKTFVCFPLARVWDPADQCTGGTTTQYTRQTYLLTTTLLDVATDLICLILPIFILRNLNINLRKKIALGLLFTVALMSVVCSCIRLSQGLTRGSSKLSVAIWGMVEATTAICVASAPALRPLVFRTSYLSSGGTSKTRSATSRRTRQRVDNGTNVSEGRLRDSFEMQPHGVAVTKVVQVTTTDVGDSHDELSLSSEGSIFGDIKSHEDNLAQKHGSKSPMGYQARIEGGNRPHETV